MARKRMIDPRLWDSEQVMSLTPELFKIYIYLISQSDDEGRIKISYRLFCTRIFPFKKMTLDKMKEMLIELHGICLIKIYSEGIHEYIYHPNWSRYQKISHPSASVLPDPDKCKLFPEYSVNAPEASSTIEFSLNKLSIDKGNGVPASPPPLDNTTNAKKEEKNLIENIIEDWNTVTSQKRNSQSKDIQKLLRARFKDGFVNIKEYKLVHRYIFNSWSGEKWHSKSSGKPSDFYIRPKTIYSEGKLNGYGDGFAEYLEQARGWVKKIKETPKCPKCGKSWENEINNNKSHCMGCNTPIPKNRGP